MTALIQKLNSHFPRVAGTDSRTLILQFLSSIFITFLAEFYLIKFQEYHQVTTQTIIGKSLWVFFASMLAFELRKRNNFLFKFAYCFLAILITVNFLVPFIARNFTFLALETRQYVMALNNDFIIYSNNFGVIPPVILIWAYVFHKKKISLWSVSFVTLLFTILSISNPATENMKLLFSAFSINYSFMSIVQSIFCASIVFPFWFILIEASTTTKPISFKKVISAFIMLTYALLYFVSEIMGTFSLYEFSYAFTLAIIFAFLVIKTRETFLEKLFVVSPIKYLLFLVSITGIVQSESSIFIMHSIVLFLFSLFLIKYSFSQPKISRFKEVHYE